MSNLPLFNVASIEKSQLGCMFRIISNPASKLFSLLMLMYLLPDAPRQFRFLPSTLAQQVLYLE